MREIYAVTIQCLLDVSPSLITTTTMNLPILTESNQRQNIRALAKRLLRRTSSGAFNVSAN
ncbi:hypothetical protein L0Z72_00410 [candidate division KSB1 bacterium]|nr:hypothetical protein [candidate division KSB1 bacterium]